MKIDARSGGGGQRLRVKCLNVTSTRWYNCKVKDGVKEVTVCLDEVEEDVTVECGGPGTGALTSQTEQKVPEKPDQTQTTTRTHQHHH